MYGEIMTMIDLVPEGYREYKRRNGCHFNRQLCEFAVARMEGEDGKPIKPLSKQEVEKMLEDAKVKVEHQEEYDHVFVANMGLADYLGDSVPDMEHLAKYVKNVLDDPDGYEGIAFCRWVADCVGKKVEVPWDEMM